MTKITTSAFLALMLFFAGSSQHKASGFTVLKYASIWEKVIPSLCCYFDKCEVGCLVGGNKILTCTHNIESQKSSVRTLLMHDGLAGVSRVSY